MKFQEKPYLAEIKEASFNIKQRQIGFIVSPELLTLSRDRQAISPCLLMLRQANCLLTAAAHPYKFQQDMEYNNNNHNLITILWLL